MTTDEQKQAIKHWVYRNPNALGYTIDFKNNRVMVYLKDLGETYYRLSDVIYTMKGKN